MKYTSKVSRPFIPSSVLNVYQEGGVALTPASPPDAGGMDTVMQEIVQGAMQAAQTQDKDLALSVCVKLAETLGSAQAPTTEVPAEISEV